MALVVRDAIPDDVSFIFHANREMARETEDKELDPLTLQRGIDAVLADPGRGFYLIGEESGRQAGTLLVTSEWSDWRNGFFWWVQSVYVLPDHRGRRVYSALHREVLCRARERGDIRGVRLYVDRENAHAHAVYTRLGMEISRYDFMEQPIP